MIKLPSSFYNLNIKKYYLDFFITNTCLFVSIFCSYKYNFLPALIVAWISSYRSGAFIHEIAHQYNRKDFKTFQLLWDLTIGLFILLPSPYFKYSHLQHHKIGVFATKEDGQYPLIKTNKLLAFFLFIFLPLLSPIFNLVFVLSTFLPFHSKFAKVIYGNSCTTKEQQRIDRLKVYYNLAVLLFLSFCLYFNLYKILFIIYIVQVGGWALSTLRIPLEHKLESYVESEFSNSFCQLTDSYTFTSNPFLAFILQPLALRYHTAHHMFPDVPYTNLKLVHEYLLDVHYPGYENQII